MFRRTWRLCRALRGPSKLGITLQLINVGGVHGSLELSSLERCVCKSTIAPKIRQIQKWRHFVEL